LIKFRPGLLALINVYAEEAISGRSFISSDLESLSQDSNILEIGGGVMLLSCQLVREGFKVTSLEPIGIGFSYFKQLRNIVIERARLLGCLPQISKISAEMLREQNIYDFAFSINVMEHVDDIDCVIKNIQNSLKVEASYRFTCPNYPFLYEPHFNIPTLISKRLTERIFRKKIFQSKETPDSVGVWNSINWITVFQIRRIVSKQPVLTISFNRCYLISVFERIKSDQEFANRRSPVVRSLILLFVKFHIHQLIRWVLSSLQPIIDCRIQKVCDLEVS